MFFDAEVYEERREIESLMRKAERDAPHYVPLYKEVLERRLCFQKFYKNDIALQVHLKALCGIDRQLITIIADNDSLNPGPEAFSHAWAAIADAKCIVIHAGKPWPDQYAATACAARMLDRVVLIECAERDVPAWTAVVAKYAPNLKVNRAIPEEGEWPIPK